MKKLGPKLAFAWLCLLTPALAAGEGIAVGVNPDAVSRHGAAERILVVGTDVSVGERVVTGPTGHVQLLFDDETRLVVGPGSALEIETYLLNGNRADRFAVNALAGTFRFISGNSAKSAYSIDTPTASIAVRGTEFDVTVAGGRTLAMLHEGALQMCHDGACVDLVRRCDLGVVGGGMAAAFDWTDEQRTRFIPSFPLPNIQSAFRPDFRISGAQSCLALPSGQPGTSLAPAGGTPSGSTSRTTQTPCVPVGGANSC